MRRTDLSIYADYHRAGRLRQPPRQPTSTSPLPEPAPAARAVGPHDDELLDVLAARPNVDETIDQAFRRKEALLRAYFATLSIDQAVDLHARLARGASDDPVAAQFSRLAQERRERLLGVLREARRRPATVAGGAR
jgi:hypothetical protein